MNKFNLTVLHSNAQHSLQMLKLLKLLELFAPADERFRNGQARRNRAKEVGLGASDENPPAEIGKFSKPGKRYILPLQSGMSRKLLGTKLNQHCFFCAIIVEQMREIKLKARSSPKGF